MARVGLKSVNRIDILSGHNNPQLEKEEDVDDANRVRSAMSGHELVNEWCRV